MSEHVDSRRWLSGLRSAAEVREQAGLRRALLPRGPADRMIDLAGNDYLGLARHPTVIEASTRALSGYGLGATGSRLVRGTTQVHADLEAALATWFGASGALVYSSGYLANLGALRLLAGPSSTVISDAHNHASLVDGCRATRARVIVTPHCDLEAVDAALASLPAGSVLSAGSVVSAGSGAAVGSVPPGRVGPVGPPVVVTESVFSVNGDLAPLRELHAIVRRHGALLLVDDAHAVGLLGPAGAGGVAAAGLSGEPDVIVTATLSKSFGAAGGVIAGPAEAIAALVDTGRTFIYDTGLPPMIAAGCLAALDIIRDGDDLRTEVLARGVLISAKLAATGLPIWEPAAGVLSVGAPSPSAALDWAATCRERGVAVGCFRPPSTPDGSSRLRLTINAGIARSDFEHAIDVILETAP